MLVTSDDSQLELEIIVYLPLEFSSFCLPVPPSWSSGAVTASSPSLSSNISLGCGLGGDSLTLDRETQASSDVWSGAGALLSFLSAEEDGDFILVWGCTLNGWASL